MMWLLSDEEINKLMEAADDLDVDWPPLVARAQLRKIVEKLGPYIESLTKDDRNCPDDHGNILVDPVAIAALDYYWAELEGE